MYVPYLVKQARNIYMLKFEIHIGIIQDLVSRVMFVTLGLLFLKYSPPIVRLSCAT